jgi:hypothetical protein
MPDHIKMILRHALLRFLIALAFVGGLLAFNVANLWHLVTHTSEGRSRGRVCSSCSPRDLRVGADRLQDHVDGRGER